MFGGFQSVSVRYAGQKVASQEYLHLCAETPKPPKSIEKSIITPKFARLATPPAFVYAAVLDPRARGKEPCSLREAV